MLAEKQGEKDRHAADRQSDRHTDTKTDRHKNRQTKTKTERGNRSGVNAYEQ